MAFLAQGGGHPVTIAAPAPVFRLTRVPHPGEARPDWMAPGRAGRGDRRRPGIQGITGSGKPSPGSNPAQPRPVSLSISSPWVVFRDLHLIVGPGRCLHALAADLCALRGKRVVAAPVPPRERRASPPFRRGTPPGLGGCCCGGLHSQHPSSPTSGDKGQLPQRWPVPPPRNSPATTPWLPRPTA